MNRKSLRKILCVEDDPDIQAIIRLALESLGGFTVETCASGQEAVDTAPDIGPDLVLLDVMMPDMDGPATLTALRRIPCLVHTPVVFMTAKVSAQENEDYRRLGAAGVITKPFDPMRLAAELAGIWERGQLGA
jgi:two-component system OmpR family response regulator